MTRAESRTLDETIRRLAELGGHFRMSVTAIAARVGLERTAVSHRLSRMGIRRPAPPPANRVPDPIRDAMVIDLNNGFTQRTVALVTGVSLRTVGTVAREGIHA
jgi:DNA invertase Pin-like site-specific DNA recombinase